MELLPFSSDKIRTRSTVCGRQGYTQYNIEYTIIIIFMLVESRINVSFYYSVVNGLSCFADVR